MMMPVGDARNVIITASDPYFRTMCMQKLNKPSVSSMQILEVRLKIPLYNIISTSNVKGDSRR